MSDKVYSITTENAPAAIGPYSQAVVAGDMMFVSGQIPIVPSTGAVIEGGIVEQAKQVFENIGGILRAAGKDFSDVIKTTVLLTNIGDFATVNEIYASYFTKNPLPARAAYQVAALPKNVMIEVEVVVYMGK